MNANEATTLLLDFLEKGYVVKSVVEHENKFLFIAHGPDPIEGYFDPFFMVDKETREIIDFSPQDYPNPLEIINKLKAVYVP